MDMSPGDLVRIRINARVIDIAVDRKTGCVGIGEPTGCWIPPHEPDHIGTMPVIENHEGQSDGGAQARQICGGEDDPTMPADEAGPAVRLLLRMALREEGCLKVLASYVENPSKSIREHAAILGMPKSTIDDTMARITQLLPGVERLLRETTKASMGQKARRRREADACKP